MVNLRLHRKMARKFAVVGSWVRGWLPGFVKPSVHSYRDLASPSWSNTRFALVWVGVASLISATVIEGLAWIRPGNPELSSWMGGSPAIRILVTVFLNEASFLVEVCTIQFFGWILGGRGTLSELAFLFSIYPHTVDMVFTVLSAVFSGSILALPMLCLLPIYAFGLRYAAVRATHRLSKGAAIAAILPGSVVTACVTFAIVLAGLNSPLWIPARRL
jgi:hypothetical protein